MKKKTVIILVLAVVAGAIYFIYPKSAKNNSTAVPAQQNVRNAGSRVLSVDTYVIKSHGVTDVYPVNSFFLPSEEVDLCFEASGRITEIMFKEGTFVEKNQLLAKVNDAKLQAQLKKLQAQLDLYNSKEFRQKSLLAQDAISQETYDESNTLVEATLADIELVKAQIRETELRAPFDGFIGLRQMSEGAYANPTTVVAKLTKISPLKMELSIPEAYIDMVKAGNKILFTVDGDTLQYQAEVYATESKIDMTTLSFTIRAYYPNLDRKIPPGRFAHVVLQLNYDKHGISVPSESVVPDLGEHIVYKVENSKAKKAQIDPGVRTESYVQILKGLNVGDTVITTGILQLRDGIDIQINSVR
ncbi:MAG: efflux RND transporter periplasmic adaptor subunit [Prevotellaceae bacterium]|jgi:membrane fusion protein (multidrug efflux system)|nr:efflux RND transporter periplasmic adaptor subunit [Prevotellaceae bacterium]